MIKLVTRKLTQVPARMSKTINFHVSFHSQKRPTSSSSLSRWLLCCSHNLQSTNYALPPSLGGHIAPVHSQRIIGIGHVSSSRRYFAGAADDHEMTWVTDLMVSYVNDTPFLLYWPPTDIPLNPPTVQNGNCTNMEELWRMLNSVADLLDWPAIWYSVVAATAAPAASQWGRD